MSIAKRTLQFATGSGDEVVKPEPPENLWDAMDAILAEERVQMNDEGCTHAEFARRYGLTEDQARHQCGRLAAKGRLISGWRTLSNGRTVRVFRIPE